MTNQQGFPTNAIYGFIRSIEKIIKDFHPDYLAVIFDGPDNKASRTAIYADYKSHRQGMPDELATQLDKTYEFCRLYGLPLIQIPGVEADDVIGSIVHWAKDHDIRTYICSSDKDLCQLVSPKCQMINVNKDNLLVDEAKVKELFGVRPDQIIDLLAIMGDTSDNIPGISGFGPKTALKLLDQFGTLDHLLEHLDELENPKQRDKISAEKEIALLSQKLATIQMDVEVPTQIEEYAPREKDIQGLQQFYRELNFTSLLKSLDTFISNPSSPKKNQTPSTNHLINDLDSLQHVLEKLKKAPIICIDTETTSLDKMQAQLVGVGLAIDAQETFYLPFNGAIPRDYLMSALKALCQSDDHAFFGHNIKYDLHVLANHDIFVRHVCFDTMIASYLIHPEKNQHGLDHIVEAIFGVTKQSYKELMTVDKKQIPIGDVPLHEVCQYCCADVHFTYLLKEHFCPLIDELQLSKTFYEIEMPLVPILFMMERKGVFVDEPLLKQMSISLSSDLKHLEETIYQLAGQEFNIKSPKQLSHLLFEELKIPPFQKKKATGYSTSIDVLEKLVTVHPIIQKIIDFRMLEKLRSTYVDALPEQINPHTHRIHCSFNQTGTATGRLASQDPNLQNIPIRTEIGKQIRTAFRPKSASQSFLSADYSQIELRIVAHLSEDPQLIHAFKHSADVHTATAALIFNVSEAEVTKEMRHQAKAVNFGIIYGQQAFGLSKELGIDMRDAAQFIKTYFKRYPRVEEFLEKAKNDAKEAGAAITITGRRRPLPELNSQNAFIKAQGERFAVNSPIQGTQADLIKMAMIKIDQKMAQKALQSELILQIHDELIFECPDYELEEMTQLVTETMENIYPLLVPLKVDITIGKNWGEC